MITMKVERQYIDVFVGSIYCTHKGEEKKLAEFVFTHNSKWTYKGVPCGLDGVYKARYDHFGEDGFQFRPVVNKKGLQMRYQERRHPHPMAKNVMYLLVKKSRWEEMCRYLISEFENKCEIVGYDEREKLEMIPDIYLNIEDEDENFLDDWESEEE